MVEVLILASIFGKGVAEAHCRIDDIDSYFHHTWPRHSSKVPVTWVEMPGSKFIPEFSEFYVNYLSYLLYITVYHYNSDYITIFLVSM